MHEPVRGFLASTNALDLGEPLTPDRHEGDIPDYVDSTTGHELRDSAGR